MKQLLIIGFVWPEPKSSAAGSRMMQLIELFKELHFEITFVSTALNIEFSENLQNHGIKTKSIQLNDSGFDVFCKNLNPAVVLFDRFLTEEQFGWRIIENCPDAIRILDTEDLHCLRQTRQWAVKNNVLFDRNTVTQSDIAKREVASIYRCDLSLMVSEYEIDVLQDVFLVPLFLLYYLPLVVDSVTENKTAFGHRNDFVFIGNFLHEPNYDAVRHLRNVIWPEIYKHLPNAKMNVYGAYPTQKVFQLQNTAINFMVHGRAKNAADVIKSAKVMLAPIRFGAGIKGKLIEAMQYATPSITTTIGAESMHDYLPWNGYITDDTTDFIKKAVTLYTNESIWNTAVLNGHEIIKQRYLKTLFANNFKEKITDLMQHYILLRNKNFTGSLLLHQTANGTKYMSKWIEEKNKSKKI